MEAVLEQGLELIYAIQALRSPALDAIFGAITFLGDLEFYLLLAPIIIWCVDYGLGSRIGILVLLSGSLNVLLKDAIMQPRPCELDPRVCIDEATGYGLPSGHSQNAVVFWGVIAAWFRSTRVWIGAALLMLMIGLSRIYLGVHFPTDVLAGWTIGAVILGLYLGLGERVERWLKASQTAPQLLISVAIAALLIAIDRNAEIVAAASSFAGLSAGIALTQRIGGFSADGSLAQKAIRYALGVAGTIGLFFGLGSLLPPEGRLGFAILLFGLIGAWISLGAPWLFVKLGLAESAS